MTEVDKYADVKELERKQWLADLGTYTVIEPRHEIMALLVLRKLVFQMHMRSHPVGLDV